MQLSDIRETTVLSPATHARYPGAPCPLYGAANTIPLIAGSHALMIGPAECLYNVKMNIRPRTRSSDPRPDNLLLMLLDQDDIVFGVDEKVRRAVIEADERYHPEVLFVVTTCTQEIVGEDFDAIIDQVRSQTRAELLVVHTENFTCTELTKGIENTYLALCDLMEAAETRPGSVNLIGVRSLTGRKSEPVRILEEKGVEVLNVVPARSSLDEIRRAPAASLNIVMEHYALPLARRMEQEFGIPLVYVERSYTPKAVADGYRRIAQTLGIDLEAQIERLRRPAAARIRALREVLAGKTFVLGGQAGRTFDLARLMTQLGMEPLQLHLHELLPDDPSDIRALLADGYDPPVVNAGSAVENDRLLAELQPDYYVGHADARTMARLGIQGRNVIPATQFPGFMGVQIALGLLARPPAGTEILHYKEQMILAATGSSPWL